MRKNPQEQKAEPETRDKNFSEFGRKGAISRWGKNRPASHTIRVSLPAYDALERICADGRDRVSFVSSLILGSH